MKLPVCAALGTMHGKEVAIAPPLGNFGIAIVVPDRLDTDNFGTFTGEVPRAGTMEQAACAKTRAAIAATGLPVGIASEGAYGPHPAIPFLTFGRELIMWRNEETGQEIVERLNDDAPIYSNVEVTAPEEAYSFLARISFPTVALVVAPAGARDRPIAKGIRDHVALSLAIAKAVQCSPEGRAFIQTDMRAHVNLRRMAVIAVLADRFALRLATPCPICQAPGFGATRIEAGLPCSGCGTATALAKAIIQACNACLFETSGQRPDGWSYASPAECPECNP